MLMYIQANDKRCLLNSAQDYRRSYGL